MPDETRDQREGASPAARSEAPIRKTERIGDELRGTLPCISCSYELQGLSVAGNCPECGLAVRATILYRVDPHAEAFAPMPHRRLTANLFVVWMLGALVGVALAWAPRAADVVGLMGTRPDVGPLLKGPAIAIGISGLASIVLIRPVVGVRRAHIVMASIAVALYALLVFAVWKYMVEIEPANPSVLLRATSSAEQLHWRLMIEGLILLIILGLRPNARMLALRSLVLRTGRVDRQTMLAMAGALVVAMTGEVIQLFVVGSELISILGVVLVVVGSLFFTLGVASATVDCWRIRRAILTPSPSLRQLLGEPG